MGPTPGGFLSEIIGGAKEFFISKEQARSQERQIQLTAQASSNALTLRGQQAKALMLAAVAGLGIVLLMRRRRGR